MLIMFIGELGEDASARYVPTVQSFIHDVGQKIAQDAGPKVGAFVENLVKDHPGCQANA